MVGMDTMTETVQAGRHNLRYRLGSVVYSVGCVLTDLGDTILDG